jgi:Flp pilus assembly protein TadG
MISHLRRFARNSVGTAAVETAIFAPIFLIFTLGITDLGVGMFVKMQVNAATQAGAAYAVINTYSGSPPVCASMTATCLSNIQTAMNNASGNASFCTTATCTASFTSCADANGGICFAVSANYPYTPILPDAVYTWASAQTYSSTVTVRIQ